MRPRGIRKSHDFQAVASVELVESALLIHQGLVRPLLAETQNRLKNRRANQRLAAIGANSVVLPPVITLDIDRD